MDPRIWLVTGSAAMCRVFQDLQRIANLVNRVSGEPGRLMWVFQQESVAFSGKRGTPLENAANQRSNVSRLAM
jgi:hypothetical protein